MLNPLDNLIFRRQFLFCRQNIPQLQHWQQEKLGEYNIYVHPDCGLMKYEESAIHLILIGYIIDPHSPESTNLDILHSLSQCHSIDGICKRLYSLTGRFVLIIKQNDEYLLVNDPFGLRSVFYTKQEGSFCAASQPLLLDLVFPLKKSANYFEYKNSGYVKKVKEHALPVGISLYENVFHVVPNHYLHIASCRQTRFWPSKELKSIAFEQAVFEAASLLKQIMIAANKRFKLALALTAGWDSRIILSASLPIAKDIVCYTLKYRDLKDGDPEIKIPKHITKKLGIPHKVIDCNKPVREGFKEVYECNTDLSHFDDWGLIANGMLEEYPNERVAIKGNAFEIARCLYYPDGTHGELNSIDDMVELVYNWKDINFIYKSLWAWFEELKPIEINRGYDLLDLSQWEQRTAGWQAQSQLEWDIVQEAFTPANNRELLDIMLRVPTHYRAAPNHIFFRSLLGALAPEMLKYPINPKPYSKQIRSLAKRFLKKFILPSR